MGEIFYLTDCRGKDSSPLAIPQFLASYFLEGPTLEPCLENRTEAESKRIHLQGSSKTNCSLRLSRPRLRQSRLQFTRRSAAVEAFRRRHRKLRIKQLSSAAAVLSERNRQKQLDILGSSALGRLQWEPVHDAGQFDDGSSKPNR